MLILRVLLIGLLATSLLVFGCRKAEQEKPASDVVEVYEGWTLEDVGFEAPESVFFDADADVYYVSNLGGPQPLDKDDNGFISRITADGLTLDLKWIAGGTEGIQLHAPKGMDLYGDWLLVSDIDRLRVFDINTGEAVMEIPLPGATFANDVSSSEGIVYVTDTGTEGPGAIYTVVIEGQDGQPEVDILVRGEALQNPNGILEKHDGIWMVPYGGNSVFQLEADGSFEVVAHSPTGALDGLVFLNDGRFAFSSWEGKAVYTMDSEHTIEPLFTELESPADIGYDSKRNLLLIPQMMLDKVVAMPVG